MWGMMVLFRWCISPFQRLFKLMQVKSRTDATLDME